MEDVSLDIIGMKYVGLRKDDVKILRYIFGSANGAQANELQEATELSHSALHRHLNFLIKKEYIGRSQSADERYSRYKLKPEGITEIKKYKFGRKVASIKIVPVSNVTEVPELSQAEKKAQKEDQIARLERLVKKLKEE